MQKKPTMDTTLQMSSVKEKERNPLFGCSLEQLRRLLKRNGIILIGRVRRAVEINRFELLLDDFKLLLGDGLITQIVLATKNVSTQNDSPATLVQPLQRTLESLCRARRADTRAANTPA